MMGFDMGLMMLLMLVGLLVLLATVGVAVYLGLRVTRRRGGELEQGDSARALLDRRLVAGEISADEYYERESALRDSQRVPGRR